MSGEATTAPALTTCLRTARRAALAAVGWALLLPGNLALATGGDPAPLLRELASPRQALSLEKNVLRHRHVAFERMDFGDEIRLNLFADADLRLEKVRVHRNDLGGDVWQGATEGGKGARAFLSRVGGAIAGNVWADGKLYEIRHRESGTHIVTEVDHSAFDREGCTADEDDFEHRLAESLDSETRVADPSGVIDLLVLYTPLAKSRQGGAEGVEALIHLAISVTNASFDDSDVHPRFSPVHIDEIDYAEAAIDNPGGDEDWNVFDDRNRLRDPGDGFMDLAHTLRERYCADIVHLITGAGGGWCGAAYIQQTPMDATHEAKGFAVTKDSCAVGNFTFAHEMGHTFGAQHDWYVDDSDDPWVYSHGHVNRDEGWRTIMSYDDFCDDAGPGCQRIGRWSNPNRFHGGKPVGMAEGTDDSCLAGDISNPMCDAENYRVLNNNASTVANFRQRQECLQSASRNVWMKDTWFDTGQEPDPFTVGQKMWKSPYIWVRNDFDGTGEFQHIHQNPEFGSTNYVYVKLHNDFELPASGQLKLYWAEASTGLDWPGDWTQFASVGVNNIAAYGTLLQPAAWDPPGTGHYCLLARWTGPNNPFDPMTSPEGPVIGANVRNNNNIVWRNVNILDVEPNVPFAGPGFKVKNNSPTDPFATLAVEFPPESEPFLGAGGRLWLDLGDAMAPWLAAGGGGDGIRVVEHPQFGQVVEIVESTGGPSTIDRLQLPAGLSFDMNLMLEAPVVPIPPTLPSLDDEPDERPDGPQTPQAIPEIPGNVFHVDVVQYQAGEEIGGVGYQIVVRPTSSGAGAVPDGAGVPGTPLQVDRDATGGLTLSWSPSCRTTDVDYAVYAGQLGDFTSHVPVECSTGGATSRDYPLPASSTYYLVVPTDGAADGSYGLDGSGSERPESLAACRLRVMATCPAE